MKNVANSIQMPPRDHRVELGIISGTDEFHTDASLPGGALPLPVESSRLLNTEGTDEREEQTRTSEATGQCEPGTPTYESKHSNPKLKAHLRLLVKASTKYLEVEVDEDGHGGPAEGLNSVTHAMFLMTCMSFGVGIFVMPSVLVQVGWLVGTLLIVFFGIFTTYIMLFLLDVAESHEAYSWQGLYQFAPLSRPMADFALFMCPTIGNAAHFAFITGLLFDVMAYFVTGTEGVYELDDHHTVFLLVVLTMFALPFCFQESLHSLRHVGMMIAFCVLTTAAVVVGSSLYKISTEGAPVDPAPIAVPSAKAVITGMPTIGFAFTSMLNMMEVFGSMRRGYGKELAPKKMRQAIIYSGALITFVYTSVAIVTVMALGKETGETGTKTHAGNVLYNFGPENYGLTILKFFMVIALTFDFPILSYPTVSMFLRYDCLKKHKHNPMVRGMLSTMLAIFIILIILAVPNLKDIFGLGGAVGVSILCWVLPCMIILRAHKSKFARTLAIFGIIIGLVMFFVATFFIIQDDVNLHHHPHHHVVDRDLGEDWFNHH